MELALGTVQFGLPYGIAGRDTPVPASDVRTILSRAWALGIRVLDTAAAYGDIEGRLAGLLGDHAFQVVTKIPPVPADFTVEQATTWVTGALTQAHKHLGPHLDTVMLHRAEDLLGPQVGVVWAACTEFSGQHGVHLGVSCYDIPTLNAVRVHHAVQVAQLPGNALDQRLATFPLQQPAPAVHLRSAFLQGLLLMPLAEAVVRLPLAREALQRWHAWCVAHELPPLTAALGFVKGMPHVSHCVVGVDDVGQLEAIAAAWQAAPVLHDPALAWSDLAVIDPRHWPARI